MPPPPFPTALILGSNGAVGGYLARLLQARGVAVTGVAGIAETNVPEALGIAADIAIIDADGAPRLVATGAVAAIFAVADGAPPALVAETIGAAARPEIRFCHVADLETLRDDPAVRANARAVAALRTDAGRHAANAILHHHDSRFGTAASLSAIATDAAWRASLGTPRPRFELVESGAIDWGWTPEYVDAVQRLAGLARPRDLAVASGHTLTTAEFVQHAFGFFGLESAEYVEIVPAVRQAPGDGASIAAAIKAATGWSASTWGRDLVRALCEGAAGRFGDPS